MLPQRKKLLGRRTLPPPLLLGFSCRTDKVNTSETATVVGPSAAAGPSMAAGSTSIPSAQNGQGSSAASYDKKVEILSGTHVPKTGLYSKSELSERLKTQPQGQTPTQSAGHFFGDACDDEKSVKDDDSQEGGVKLAGYDEGKTNFERKQTTGVGSDTHIGVRSHRAVTQGGASHDTPKVTGYTGPTQDDFAKLNSHVASLNLGLPPRPNISFFAEPEPNTQAPIQRKAATTMPPGFEGYTPIHAPMPTPPRGPQYIGTYGQHIRVPPAPTIFAPHHQRTMYAPMPLPQLSFGQFPPRNAPAYIYAHNTHQQPQQPGPSPIRAYNYHDYQTQYARQQRVQETYFYRQEKEQPKPGPSASARHNRLESRIPLGGESESVEHNPYVYGDMPEDVDARTGPKNAMTWEDVIAERGGQEKELIPVHEMKHNSMAEKHRAVCGLCQRMGKWFEESKMGEE